ncbi:MAG: signal peptidase I [Bacteroidia bacterium]|nr:signal peptidase I [Bacteroidia bacterium]
MTPFVYFLIASYIPTVLGLSKFFIAFGQPGWKAYIPFYNVIILLKIIKRPWWWLLLFMVPTVSFIMWWIMLYQLYESFGKKSTGEKFFGTIFWFAYLPWTGYTQNLKYSGPVDYSKVKRSWQAEWVDAGLFAVIAATIIRTFFIEAFTIPTSSLEKSLMVGDYLFVSKVSYGAKVPNTPLAFPFTHHTMFLTKDTKSYLEWIQLPYWRLPGFGKIKNNDYVVFNYPDGDTVALGAQNQSYYQLCREFGWSYVNSPDKINPYSGVPFGNVTSRPPDKRENYVKRCVAIPGDTLTIKKSIFYINGKQAYIAQTMQHHYVVKTKDGMGFSPKVLDKFDITEPIENRLIPGALVVTLPNDKVNDFKQLPNVESLTPLIADSGAYDSRIFPHSPNYKWNVDNFGPLVMPEKGITVKLDTANIHLYDRIITAYENNTLVIKGDKIFINGLPANTYTFKFGYYFMIGDNRHNSADSRYWGFVPEDHIVGKPVFVWMSWKGGFMKQARWDRFFTFVHSNGLSRSYLIHFIVIVALIYGYNYFKKKKVKKQEKDQQV